MEQFFRANPAHVDVETGCRHRLDAARRQRFADEDPRSHERPNLPVASGAQEIGDTADALAEVVVTECERGRA